MDQLLILVIGVYPEVVRRLGAALRQVGYTAVCLTDPQSAERELNSGSAAAIITSPYLEAAARKRLAASARRSGAKVIMLHAGEIADTELADAVVSGTASSLVDALQSVLPRPHEQSA